MKKRIFAAILASVFLSACEPQKAPDSQAAQPAPVSQNTQPAQTVPAAPTNPPAQPAPVSQSNQVIDATHTSENSVNWAGVYEGTVPGANSNIHTLITLGYDKKYSATYRYVDKGNESFTESGTFRWNEAGNTIILDSKDLPPYYRVGEGHLTQMDMSGNPITGKHAGSYVLKQTAVK
ncbi:lipoprotein [Betaproteobacteria bacterium]|nr:lipoprotein [Betaproteobacteria bacterium]